MTGKINVMIGLASGFYLLFFSSFAIAESVYVTDILHLGMYANPGGSGEKVETLITGVELEILERTKNHTKVRSPSGKVGWAKSAYLVSDKPSRLQLEEFTKKNQRLIDDLAFVKKKIKDERSELLALQQKAASVIEASKAQAENLGRFQKENEQFREHMATYSSSIPFSVFMPAIIICFVAGFMGCYFWVDFQSRKRHGGFRIR